MSEPIIVWACAFSISILALSVLLLYTGRKTKVRGLSALVYAVGALFIAGLHLGFGNIYSPLLLNGSSLLIWLIATPLAGGLCFGLTSAISGRSTNRLSGILLGIQPLLALGLLEAPIDESWLFQTIFTWFSPLGIRLHWAIDGINFYFVLLVVMTMPLVWLGQLSMRRGAGEIPGSLLLLFQGALLSAFLSLDVCILFLSLDLVLLLLFIMAASRKAGGGADYQFLIFALLGSLLRWGSLSFLMYINWELTGEYSSDLVVLSHLVTSEVASWWCYGALTSSFLMLVPVFPLQHWLDKFRHSPSLSFLVSGLLSALGFYAYLRVCMGLMPGPAGQMSAFFATATIILGAFYGLLLLRRAEYLEDWISLLAFALAAIGLLGVFASNEASLNGALLVFFGRAISLAATSLILVFLQSRSLEQRINNFACSPRSLLFFLLAFSIGSLCGMPGSLSWVGHFMLLSGTFMAHHAALARFGHLQGILGILALFCVVVSALTLFIKISSAPEGKASSKKPLSAREILSVVLLLSMGVALGLFPQVIISRVSMTNAAHVTRFIEGRREFAQQEGGGDARLLPLRRNAHERGYPPELISDNSEGSPEEVRP